MDILDLLQKQQERLEKIEQLLVNQKQILNLQEVCLLTGLSKSHIYKLTCYNKVPHYKQSKHLFFDKIEVENWLKSNPSKTSDQLKEDARLALSIRKKGGQNDSEK